ncbi:hypothetical protein GCM10017643_12910 [Ancylobacter dichloromethanicus]|uniref:Uncharacterized protein n=1 Tax=Ancylobacter dichloromethanicus TaxID=518825 RepID=A0A9W6J5I5_9HYPH|nr:hypothetical protein GCM10017643_12910 [Ancylobacter dichloromethanicus]
MDQFRLVLGDAEGLAGLCGGGEQKGTEKARERGEGFHVARPDGWKVPVREHDSSTYRGTNHAVQPQRLFLDAFSGRARGFGRVGAGQRPPSIVSASPATVATWARLAS